MTNSKKPPPQPVCKGTLSSAIERTVVELNWSMMKEMTSEITLTVVAPIQTENGHHAICVAYTYTVLYMRRLLLVDGQSTQIHSVDTTLPHTLPVNYIALFPKLNQLPFSQNGRSNNLLRRIIRIHHTIIQNLWTSKRMRWKLGLATCNNIMQEDTLCIIHIQYTNVHFTTTRNADGQT